MSLALRLQGQGSDLPLGPLAEGQVQRVGSSPRPVRPRPGPARVTAAALRGPGPRPPWLLRPAPRRPFRPQRRLGRDRGRCRAAAVRGGGGSCMGPGAVGFCPPSSSVFLIFVTALEAGLARAPFPDRSCFKLGFLLDYVRF